MASNFNPLGNLALTPQQQDLLFAALNSNKGAGGYLKGNTMALSAANLDGSPAQTNHGLTNFLDSPLLDYDYDFNNADSSFDFSFNDTHNDSVVTDKPEAPSTTKSDSVSGQDSPDKRSHPDDDDEEESGAKRRESEDKVSKKPGRKPLTTEPTSVSFVNPLRTYCTAGEAYTAARRNERRKTERRSVHSGSARRSISRTWRPEWRNCRRRQKRRTTRTRSSAPRSRK